MNNMLSTIPGEPILAMSSREIADLTNKRHDNVMRDIRAILKELHGEAGVLRFEDTQTNPQNGQRYPIFLLPKRETLILISGYSVKLRARIIDRWQELERQHQPPQFKIPQTMAEALRLAADLSDKVAEQKALLDAAQPKIDFYNAVTGADNVCQLALAAQIAKLPFGRNTLFRKLREHGVLVTGGARHNTPKQRYVNDGLFTVNQRTIENPKTGDPIVIHTTYATQKGIAWLVRHYGKKSRRTAETLQLI